LIAKIFNTYFPELKELHGNPFKFCDYLHTVLPEYKTAQTGECFSLETSEILAAGKKAPEEIREIEALMESVGQMQRLR